MDPKALRLLVRQKLADGILPQGSIPRVWGGPANGETCDACALVIRKAEFVMEGVSTDPTKRALQFHVECLYVWDSERTAPRR